MEQTRVQIVPRLPQSKNTLSPPHRQQTGGGCELSVTSLFPLVAISLAKEEGVGLLLGLLALGGARLAELGVKDYVVVSCFVIVGRHGVLALVVSLLDFVCAAHDFPWVVKLQLVWVAAEHSLP